MPRIPEAELERLKSEVSLVRLVEAGHGVVEFAPEVVDLEERTAVVRTAGHEKVAAQIAHLAQGGVLVGLVLEQDAVQLRRAGRVAATEQVDNPYSRTTRSRVFIVDVETGQRWEIDPPGEGGVIWYVFDNMICRCICFTDQPFSMKELAR